MVKKNKDHTPNPTSVANRDIIQRLNFLYQASAYLNSIPVPQPKLVSGTHGLQQPAEASTGQVDSSGNRRARKTRSTADLSRIYVQSMKIVGQKAVVKMDPSVKRTICKECNTILVPGLTVSVKAKKSSCHDHVMIYTCNHCRAARRIPAPPILDAASEPPLIGASTMVDSETMDTEASSAANDSPTLEPQGKEIRLKKNKARAPPLFARNVGHVIFCGNEKLPDDDGHGNGLFTT